MSVKVRAYKRGGWEVDIVVRLPSGEEVRERRKSPTTSKSASLRWGQERERVLLFERPPEPEKEVPTFKEFTPRYMSDYVRANRLKPSTVESQESILRVHLADRFDDRRLDRITDEDVQRLKGDLAKRSAKTANNVLSVLNTVLKAAVTWKVIDAMPCTIRLLKIADTDAAFYDFDVYEGLVGAAAALDPRIHLVVLLGGEAGLRLSEIIALEWPDIDRQRKSLTVRRSEWNGQVSLPKGGRPRRVPMTARLDEALAAHRHQRGPRVLYRNDGKTLTKKVIKNWALRAQRKAGITADGAVHVLRHTFCSHLAMRGAPARAIQELAGHVDLKTTQRYMHLSPGAVEAAIRLLETGRGRTAGGDMLETEATGGKK
jgi:integrase